MDGFKGASIFGGMGFIADKTHQVLPSQRIKLNSLLFGKKQAMEEVCFLLERIFSFFLTKKIWEILEKMCFSSVISTNFAILRPNFAKF